MIQADPTTDPAVFLGAGVYFAAFSRPNASQVWKIPLENLRKLGFEKQFFAYSRFATDSRWTFVKRKVRKVRVPELVRQTTLAAQQLTTVQGYSKFFAATEVASGAEIILDLGRCGIQSYSGFAVVQESLRPLNTDRILIDDESIVESIYSVNQFFWNHGIAFFRYAELLGFENHAFAPDGSIKGFDLTGVTTSLSKITARVGLENRKFRSYLDKLCQRLSSQNDKQVIDQFQKWCLDKYSVQNISDHWRKASVGEMQH